MELNKLLTFIESQRQEKKIHKATLCSMCDITPQYYNKLITGHQMPSYGIVEALIKAIGFRFIVTPAELII